MELGEGKRALGGSQISPLFRLPPHSPGDAPGPSAPCHHPRPPSLGVPLPPIPLLTGQDPSLEPDRAASSTMDQKIPKKNHFRPRFPRRLQPAVPKLSPGASSRCHQRCAEPLGCSGGVQGGPHSPALVQSRAGTRRHRSPCLGRASATSTKGTLCRSPVPPPSPPPALTSMPSAPGTPGGPGGPRGPGSPGGPRYGEKGGGEGSGRRRQTPGDVWGRGLRGVRGLPPACTGDASPEGKASTPWHPLGTSVPACAPQKGTDGDIWGMEKSPPKGVLGARNPV